MHESRRSKVPAVCTVLVLLGCFGLARSTPVPSTSLPSTPVPSTRLPSTSVPSTPVPSSPVPSKSVSSTPVPSTQLPSTPVPSTQVPSTPVPSTSVPSTSVPSTPVPSTPAPPTVRAASSSAEPPSIAASSPATELLEPDEATELQSSLPTASVQDLDVKKFLQNYGYMPTYNPSKDKWEFTDRSKTPWLDIKSVTPAPGATESADTVESAEKALSKTVDKNGTLAQEERTKFEQAIENFQRRYKLSVTGSIDEETLRFMQQPRCGVPDYASKFDTKTVPTKISPTKSAQANLDIKGKLDVATGSKSSTSRTTIGNGSGALGGTLRSKSLASVTGGRSTVSSPVAKVAARTQGTLTGQVSKSSEPISVSDLLRQTLRPKANIGEAGASGSDQVKSTHKTTEIVTEIITDLVTAKVEDLGTTTTRAASATTTLTTATTPLLSKSDLARSKRSVSGVPVQEAKVRTKRLSYYDFGSNTSSTGIASQQQISWKIDSDYLPQIFSLDELRSQFNEAFRRWAEVLPVTFVEMPNGDVLQVNIQITFLNSLTSSHFSFEFATGELARTTRTATHQAIHFNDDVQWTYNSLQGKNLIKVAVHEIGHVLGLSHSDSTESIMYPIYVPFDSSDSNFRVSIDSESLSSAQTIHGTCSGSFNTILDWVRTVGNKKRYNSLFFRDDALWVYENTNDRVKIGDPRTVHDMWASNVPTNIDAALQILPRGSSVDNLYFFKGNKYYQINHSTRAVMTNSDGSIGRLISEGWPAKTGFPRIPDNIDTAYFDKRDSNVYFFKGNQVYAYDRQEDGCCLNNYPMTISSAYPYRYSSGGLPGDIDAAYYSIHSRKVFFFKGNTFWENETYNPSANTVVNRVGPAQQWNQHWNNICDVW
ncbi:matrix metalloproteinase-21-like [Patiria miniata]|uniref:Peptidase metallopeptidase domain-containing protein n=1 Tax=Patiria miniata TaxID=46514 RepID=A0A914B408_PATMI|nr:matrix metalloproteinase-21-like [Patiria miniata]XP_038070656.1 matrix metalloproteinase-21-like [Patiria miniata]XP_038070657.1 matrix metalloproteinase-21-like [Patiria miniata]XP_038070658.1 matrix metalloproteinase-21-like [Patiria miniata]